MTAERHSHAEQKNLLDDPDECAKREAENGILQFELLIKSAKTIIDEINGGAAFKLRPGTIMRLQEVALRDIHPLAGTFRNTPISITGSNHAPPDWADVTEEVSELCAYINSNFEHQTAIHLAAYVLWKINWIHPFADGNGRTARAVSYLVLLVKIGAILPGTPTIPEQIAADKGPYYDALEAADAAHATNKVDVSDLELLIEQMLVNQLTGRPSLPSKTQKSVSNTFIARIEKASPDLRKRCYGNEHVSHQLWSVGDNIVLQVATDAEMQRAEQRSKEYGTPFPQLLAVGSAPATEVIPASAKGKIFQNTSFDAGEKYALSLFPDTYITIEGGIVNTEGGNSWEIAGTLYIARMGTEIKEDNFGSTFDLVISKHLVVRSR